MLAHYIETIRPGGGPRGYLFNLNQYAVSRDEGVSVISERQASTRTQDLATAKLNSCFYQCALLLYYTVFGYANRYTISKDSLSKLYRQDVVVFHRVSHLKAYLKQVSDFVRAGQMVLFMPHNPVSPAEEYVCMRFSFSDSGLSRWLKKRLTRILTSLEVQSLSRADYILTASPHSTDDYYRDSVACRQVFQALSFCHVNTGVEGLTSTLPAKAVLEKYNLPSNTKIVAYLGRFEAIKGFDIFLKMAASDDQNKISHTYICAGAGSMSALLLDNNAVNHLGWVSEIADIIGVSDVLVVPNRSAYFDLIILEALSMGVNVLTSKRGGALDLDAKGVHFLELHNPLPGLRQALQNRSSREEIQNSFKNRFSMTVFYQRYVELNRQLMAKSA